MADLSKPLRIMKRILILLLALMPVMVGAQDFKPLESVEVPDFPTNQIKITEGSFPSPDYSATYMLRARGMNVYLGVPPHYELFLRIDGISIPKGINAKLSMGGEEYWLATSFVSGNSVYIDIQGDHIKHIAVSGLQSIAFTNNGDMIHLQAFNDIEQELWRRTAENLAKTIDKFGIF